MTDMGIGDPIRDDLKVKLPSARAWNTLTFPSADTEQGVYASIFLYQAAEHDYQHQARHPPAEGERPGEELQCPAPVQRLVIVAGQPRIPVGLGAETDHR